MAVLIEVLPRLWKPAGAPFKSLNEEAGEWAANLLAGWEAAGKRCERRLVDAARQVISELASSQAEQVLVHQDLHGDNILAAERRPWLVIDLKPLLAEREFARTDHPQPRIRPLAGRGRWPPRPVIRRACT
jgi:streptomycin 6-kinase